MTSASINFGILSAAHYHSLHWGRAAQQNSDANFVGLWDDEQTRGQEMSHELGIPFFSRLDDLLDQCDAVGVTSETLRHPELVDSACRAGVHLLVEKPMARNLDECNQIIRSVSESDITYMQNFPKRYDEAHRSFAALVHSGKLGRVTMVRVRHGNDLRLNTQKGDAGWYADPVAAGGGALIDEGVHGADLLNWLLGYPKSVIALASDGREAEAGESSAIAIFEYSSGAIGELATSHTFAGGEASVEVYGSLGVAILSGVDLASRDLATTPFLKIAHHGDRSFTGIDTVPSFRKGKAAYHGRAVDEFVAALKAGADSPVTLEDGWRSVAMIESAYASISSGTKIPLPAWFSERDDGSY